jgi:small subunit ribosomal protein S6
MEVNNLETAVKKLYEGMFLIDSAEAARDWDGIIDFITKILTRAEAEIVSVRKWDERPLAYPIRRCTRGTYILAYFRAGGQKIHEIERDVQLSERIMRVLILKADHLTEADIAKDTPATRAERPVVQPETAPAASEESPAEGEASPKDGPAEKVETPPAEAEIAELGGRIENAE